MKILFIGDYSNLHACLASELRRLGHRITVVSDKGGYQQTRADIVLRRSEGKLGGVQYMIDIMREWSHFEGYDVVQLINPNFLRLKPGKLAYFYRELKRRNGKVFLTLCGNDYYFVRACVDGRFRFSEFRVGDERTPYATAVPERETGWLLDDVRRYSELVYESLDGAMSVLPEYDMAVRDLLGDKCVFTNIPLDLTRHPYKERDFRGPLKVMVGMKPEMTIQKGTARLLDACLNVAARSAGEVEVEGVGGLAYDDYLAKMRSADVLIDQLYSYSPATNALDAMSQGLVCATGAEPEYYEYIGEQKMRPILQLSPLIDDLEGYLAEKLSDRESLKRMAKEGRALVERHNDVREVARRYIAHWNGDPIQYKV